MSNQMVPAFGTTRLLFIDTIKKGLQKSNFHRGSVIKCATVGSENLPGRYSLGSRVPQFLIVRRIF